MAVLRLISRVENWLLNFMRECLIGEVSGMFEEMASEAVKMLVFIFWTTIAFAIIWGALWLRTSKKSKWHG
jgi:hypothetical protein